jgi:hypothetical protein
MSRRAVVLLAALGCGACGPEADRFGVELMLDPEGCGFNACENIAMPCDAEVMLRIVPADDPEAQPYAIVCERIRGGGDLCEVASLNVPDELIPNERVEIQLGIWPYDEANGGAPDCGPLEFALSGGIDQSFEGGPAIGGRTYFEVGSGTTATITLECIDAPALDAEECRLPDTVHVTVGVNDLDLPVPVPTSIATVLDVRIGAPEVLPDGTWRLDTPDTTPLEDVTGVPPHTWSEPDGAAIAFDQVACVQTERIDLPERTPAVTCGQVTPTQDELDMTAWYVDTVTVQQIREALGLDSLPASGLVVGRVLDIDGIVPEAGVTIQSLPAGATVRYLSEDLSTTEGVTQTQSSGLFVSLDAAFLTEWSGRRGLQQTAVDGFGGPLYGGKITVVVLRMEAP